MRNRTEKILINQLMIMEVRISQLLHKKYIHRHLPI
jgi:hypothetical protein